MVHNSRRPFDCFCGKSYKGKMTFERHISKCYLWKENSKEHIDYIECKICNHIGRSITQHISKKHNISKEEYEKIHGSTICDKSKEKYYNTHNYDWIKRKKAEGDDLKEWREKLGKIISKRILNSEKEREVRRQNVIKRNKSEKARKISSEIAKKTSKRKDILKKRTEVLSNWRKNNKDLFYEKCVKKFTNSWNSKPERILFEIVQKEFPQFKRNQSLKRIHKFKSTKSGKRQIDILSKADRIIIEFDGPFHFKSLFKEFDLEKTKMKDRELNECMVSENWTVIRVSYDQFLKSGSFKKECIDKIFEIIRNHKEGLFLIGDSYECNIE